MDSDILTIFCWVYGDDVYCTFPIEISRAESVADLKVAIKGKASEFRDVDVKDLELYSIPCHDDVEDDLEKWNPQGNTKLSALSKLSDLFPKDDNREWLIIADAPTSVAKTKRRIIPDISLNCWVRGHSANRVFPVDISTKETVEVLREVIKSECTHEFRDIGAKDLALYKVSIPCDKDIQDTLKHLTLDRAALLDPLDSQDILSSIFSDVPLQKHIHIVIENISVQGQRRIFLQNSPPMAPLSGGRLDAFAVRQQREQQAIYCNRPYTANATIPATLLHPVFGEFLNDCEKLDAIADDNYFTPELHDAMSDFYPDERSRAQTISSVFAQQGFDLDGHMTSDGYMMGGHTSVNGYRYLIAAFSSELGSMGADPYNQACLDYLESTRQYAESRWYSPLPCMIILFTGPFLGFAGATWNIRPVVQPLSSTLPMHYHHTDLSMQTIVARHLGAFKKAVRKLSEYYPSHAFTSLIPPSRQFVFPYPTSFMSLQENQQREFAYESHPFEDKLVFFGTLGDQKICIKFVRQYSLDAHRECASLGCAPKLLGFEKLPGKWFMVVMDRLVDEEWERPAISCRTLSASLIDSIQSVLTQWHQGGHVHGDIRGANIMVSRADETKFMLIGFDWAGKIGVVRYPFSVNDPWRPEGAVGGALILAEHDMEMLDCMKGR